MAKRRQPKDNPNPIGRPSRAEIAERLAEIAGREAELAVREQRVRHLEGREAAAGLAELEHGDPDALAGGNGEDKNELGGEDQIAFSSFLAQLGESEREARVTVYKLDDVKRIKARLFEKPLVEFLNGGEDDLARDYGTGTYYLHVWHRKTGHLLARKRRDLVQLPGQARSAAPSSTPQQPIGMTELLTILDRQQQTAFSMIEKIAGALAGRASSAPGIGVQDVVGLVATLQGMISKGATNGGGLGNLKELVDTFSSIKALVGSSGEANEQSVLLEAVRQFGGPLAEALRQSKAGAPAATPATPAALAAPGANTPPAQSTPESPAMLYRLFLRMLCEHAAANHDPETYANVILDRMPEDQVRAFLDKPDWLATLSGLEPNVANYPTWFSELRRVTLELLTSESAQPDTAATTSKTTEPPAAA
jgi:hypothetical protein